jgi:predicted dehydrogenase
MIKEDHKGYQITSVADYFPEVVQGAGERFDVPKSRCFSGLSGYKRLMASGVDAVFLETPPCFFPEHASAAVDAGLHIFMAKPVAVDVPGSLLIGRLGEDATKRKQVFLVDFQIPTDSFNIETVKRCHDGLIGNVGMLSSLYADDGFQDPPKTKTIESRLRHLIWVNDIELGGGLLVNAGIHAVDAGLWIAADRPVSAAGSSRVVRDNPHGNSEDVYSITYRFRDGLIQNHRGEHLRNTHRLACNCVAYGQYGYAEICYGGKAWVHGNKGSYPGGEVENLYAAGITRNLNRFEEDIRQQRCDNTTVRTSVNSTLVTILGRLAGQRHAEVTWDEMIAENQRIEPDLTGLNH